MTKDPNYLQLSVNDPEKTYQFLVSHLGFFKHDAPGAKRLIDKQWYLVGNRFDNNYLLTSQEKPALSVEHSEVIINTDDCLRDYHQLKMAGIKFEKKPGYSLYGLEATFIDDHGNNYKLLEKRDYSDE